MRHRDDGPGDLDIVLVRQEVPDERLIDFQPTERKPLQITEDE